MYTYIYLSIHDHAYIHARVYLCGYIHVWRKSKDKITVTNGSGQGIERCGEVWRGVEGMERWHLHHLTHPLTHPLTHLDASSE